MSSDFSYDPVTAMDEASATGATAACFADIRAVMGIPLVTSIWRGLAGMDDSLLRVWQSARPVYLHGAPAAALARVVQAAELPLPSALHAQQLHSIGISATDLLQIRAIVAAYNRSNGMNLVALASLVSEPADNGKAEPLADLAPPHWPQLLPLLAQADIASQTWAMVRAVNAFGAADANASVATLWRHLGHWPALLALLHMAFMPLHDSGRIAQATHRVAELAAEEGSQMAHLRPAKLDISSQAYATVHGYVTTTTQVVRMVTLGHTLEAWLAQ